MKISGRHPAAACSRAWLDYTEKRDLYEPGGVVGGQDTIFAKWARTGLRWTRSDWRCSDADNVACLRTEIQRGQACRLPVHGRTCARHARLCAGRGGQRSVSVKQPCARQARGKTIGLAWIVGGGDWGVREFWREGVRSKITPFFALRKAPRQGQRNPVPGRRRPDRQFIRQDPKTSSYISNCGRAGSGQSRWKNLPRGLSVRS